MEPNQAAEQLQAIRTLMERSAIYRRALAPIMTYCGVVGIIGGVAGNLLALSESRAFVVYWSAMAALALGGSFLLVRRQALRDSEPFWSPPTRRVTNALIPGLIVGAFVGSLFAWGNNGPSECRFLVPIWCLLYGMAIHSASFFMPRGLKLFGWIFIIAGIGAFVGCVMEVQNRVSSFPHPHWLMGITFGGLHLAYGIYLYFTEKRGMTS